MFGDGFLIGSRGTRKPLIRDPPLVLSGWFTHGMGIHLFFLTFGGPGTPVTSEAGNWFPSGG